MKFGILAILMLATTLAFGQSRTPILDSGDSITNGLASTSYVNAAVAPYVKASSGTATNLTVSGSLTAPDASSTAPSAVANVGTLDARYIGTTGTNFTMTGNVGERPTLTLTSTGANTSFTIVLQSRGAAGELYTGWARSAVGVWRFNPGFDVVDGTSAAATGDYILQAKSSGVTVGRTAGGSAGNFTVIGSATTSRVASVQFYANSTGTAPSNVVTFALGDARYPTNGASWTFGGILAASYGTDPASTGLTQNVAIGGTTLVFKAGIFTGTAP